MLIEIAIDGSIGYAKRQLEFVLLNTVQCVYYTARFNFDVSRTGALQGGKISVGWATMHFVHPVA